MSASYIEAMKFQDLPPEILSSIGQWLTDLSTIGSFAQLTSATRSLYGDDDWRDICLRASFSRPRIWRHRPWRSITASIVHHARSCRACARALQRMHDMAAHCPSVFSDTKAAPSIKLIGEMRQSIGAYNVDWLCDRLVDRPVLSDTVLQRGLLSGQKVERLLHHPTLACRLAFTQPIEHITLGFESADDRFQFDGYGGKSDPARIRLDLEDEDYEAESILAVRYRSNAKNRDGLTCLDVLHAAGNVPGPPVTCETKASLCFHGILDDSIRQSIIWIQTIPDTRAIGHRQVLPQNIDAALSSLVVRTSVSNLPYNA